MKILGEIKNLLTKGIGIRDKDVLMSWFGDYWQMSKPAQAGYISACLNTMGNFFAKAKFRLYKRVGESLVEIYEHPFLELWENPNNYQVENELKHYMGEFFGVFGNYYLLKVRGLASKEIREYQLLDPTKTAPEFSNGRLTRYVEDLGTRKIYHKAEDVYHFKYLSAYSSQVGIPIIKAISDILDIDAYQTAYMKEFYDNGGFLGQVFTTTQNLRPAEFTRAKEELKKEYAGEGKSHKMALFTGGLQPIRSAYSLKEMEMSLQRKQVLLEIMTAFRIPQILLGGEGDTYTKATAQAAEANYASTMIDPSLTYIEQVLTKHVRQDYKDKSLVVKHDPVAPKDIEENLSYYKAMVGLGALSINEVRIMEDWDKLDFPLADSYILNVGGGAIDLKTGEIIGKGANSELPRADDKIIKSEDELKLHWKQSQRYIDKDLKWFSRRVDEFFDEQKKRILERLDLKDWVETFLDSENEMLQIFNMIENGYTRFLERGFMFSGGTGERLISEGLKAQLQHYSRSINETSKKKIQERLSREGLSRELIEKIYDNFKEVRSPLIAETTGVSGFNAGLWMGYRNQGYTKKIWVSQRDVNVRHSHFVADGQKVGIDEAFSVGNDLMQFPGDPTASPEEVINCRCVLIGEK